MTVMNYLYILKKLIKTLKLRLTRKLEDKIVDLCSAT